MRGFCLGDRKKKVLYSKPTTLYATLFLALLLCSSTGWKRRRPQNSLFQRCHHRTRGLMQRTLPTTAAGNIQAAFARFEHLLLIPRAEQCPGACARARARACAPPLQRRRNAESHVLRRDTHICVAAKRGTERALAGPECHRACTQFGDALRRGGAEAQEVRAGELRVGRLREERERGR